MRNQYWYLEMRYERHIKWSSWNHGLCFTITGSDTTGHYQKEDLGGICFCVIKIIHSMFRPNSSCERILMNNEKKQHLYTNFDIHVLIILNKLPLNKSVLFNEQIITCYITIGIC